MTAVTDAQTVTHLALWLSGLSFAVYVVEAAYALFSKPVREARNAARDATRNMLQAQASIDDVTKLAEALSKLTDSLAKAGPALTSLVAAVLFLGIAALTSGALRGSPAEPATAPASQSELGPQTAPPEERTGKPREP